MPRFDDYHRTVVGYHETVLSSALRLVTRTAEFRPSRRDFDWLGHGIYFWEYAPRQALRFAAIRQRQLARKRDKSPAEVRRASEPLAVVACMIRLGNCFDLLEPDHVLDLSRRFAEYQGMMALANQTIPRNTRRYRRLDCAVFEFTYKIIEEETPGRPVESARVSMSRRAEPKGSGTGVGFHATPTSRFASASRPTSLGLGCTILAAWRSKMSIKRYKMPLSPMSRAIRKANRAMRVKPLEEKVEIMVRAKVLSREAADVAIARIKEMRAAGLDPMTREPVEAGQ